VTNYCVSGGDPKFSTGRPKLVELLPVSVVGSVRSYTFGMATLFPATMTATGVGAMMQPEVLLTGECECVAGPRRP
jgi:hypothetical protein